MCHGAVNVGGVSVRLRGPEVHLQGEVRHRGHPKAAESQNQNDSNHFVSEDTDKVADKDTDKVAIGDTVKFAIVSSVFVGLRTILVSSIYPSVVVGESGQSAVIEASPSEFRHRF